LAKDQWELDRRETKALTKLGNNVLRFWQSELQNNPEECIQRIIEAMKFN
jgi:very-short-patch-repair endonuclease